MIKKTWEERMSLKACHIDVDKEKLFSLFRRRVSEEVTVSGKTVIDFGCGGGWLGRYLFDNCSPRLYLGLDISERSRAFAEENVPEGGFVGSKVIPRGFDIFVCLSVIQHFPNFSYLSAFLSEVNDCRAVDLILQIRAGENKIRENPYESIDDVIFALTTNSVFLEGKLTNYFLKKASKISEGSNYQYLYFRRKT